MNLPEIIPPYKNASDLTVVELPFALRSPRQLITRAVWNSVATFASVAQTLRLTAPQQPYVAVQLIAHVPNNAQLVCHDNLPVRARRSFTGAAIPRKGEV